ncbi:serine/threonine protein kinase [Ktedonospora formicarum]|uniref:Protein kinase domain-containing protein n=1 Tax=Ktedonospora formicarum TaxID=2778364 RepID=A0A8J3I610_9CHLR|nr:serine/threonine-protein kinase [Ktedonospora formicarum]GHO49281.1 hypothetical protein KSX_74440 [Ktedonospora formicarum]
MINPGGQQQLGNYHIIRRLGTGGFADVYLGEHVHLGRLAAIKVLRSRDSHHGFLTEAKRVAALRHPHIISILDFGLEDEFPYLVMDYAPQGTLRERHPRGQTVPLPTIVNYVRDIASGLQYAHQQKIIHRDVKPENILLGANGETLLGDFGIAIIAHRMETMTPQTAQGTYTYMAPEQAQGHATPESDQYSLAVVVYEWLCGYPPFFGGSIVDIAVGHAKEPPPSLSQRQLGIPSSIEHIVFKALAKTPQERYSSVQEFSDALEETLKTYKQPTEVVPPPATPRVVPAPPTPVVNPPAHTPVMPSPAPVIHTTGEQSKRLQDYFSQPAEIIQLALIAEKKADWQKQQNNSGNTGQGSTLDADTWYHSGLMARAQGDMYGAILCWQQGLKIDATYNNGVLIKLIREELRQLQPSHLKLLAGRVEQAKLSSKLDEEIRLLEDMQTLAPQDQSTSEQLFRARQDKEYNWMYEKARKFLASGDVVLAIEQVSVLQSLAPDFRGLTEIREQLMLSIGRSADAALANRDLVLSKQQIIHMRRVLPQDERLRRLEKRWSQAIFHNADQAIMGNEPISALTLIESLREITPNYPNIGTLRQRAYNRACEVTRRSIKENDFADARNRLNEIAQHFAAPEQAQYDHAVIAAQQAAYNNQIASKGGSTARNQATPNEVQLMTYSQLKDWLPQMERQHIASEQKKLFLQGEQAQNAGKFAEARNIFEQLRQQKPTLPSDPRQFIMDDQFYAAVDKHIKDLTTRQARAAEKARDWQQAHAYWQQAIDQDKNNRVARNALTIVEQNQRYTPVYQQAKQLVAQKQFEQARPLLKDVWSNARQFGDPDHLASETEMYSPLSRKSGTTIVTVIALTGALTGLFTHLFWLGLVLALIIASICCVIMLINHRGQPRTIVILALLGCFLAALLMLPIIGS